MNEMTFKTKTSIAPKNASGGGIKNNTQKNKNIKLPRNGIGKKPIRNTSTIKTSSCSVIGIAYIIYL